VGRKVTGCDNKVKCAHIKFYKIFHFLLLNWNGKFCKDSLSLGAIYEVQEELKWRMNEKNDWMLNQLGRWNYSKCQRHLC